MSRFILHLLFKRTVLPVPCFNRSIRIQTGEKHLPPSGLRPVAAAVGLGGGIPGQIQNRLVFHIGQHPSELHVRAIIERRISRLIIAVILPCHAAPVLGILHKGKQLVVCHLRIGVNADGRTVRSPKQKLLSEISKYISCQAGISLRSVIRQRILRSQHNTVDQILNHTDGFLV